MATTVSHSTTTSTAISGCSAELTEQIARAECFLRIETQKAKLEQAIVVRRAEATEKFLATLCAITGDFTLAQITEAHKTLATVLTAADADQETLNKIGTVLTERYARFKADNAEALRAALEKRLTVLNSDLTREKKDTETISHQIHALEKRLAELPPCHPDHVAAEQRTVATKKT